MKKALLCCFGIILALWAGVSPVFALEPPALSPEKPGLLPTFYDVPADLVLGKPGSIIRLESIDAPDDARAWRVVYRSRTVSNAQVAVSGLIIVPKSAQSGNDVPVVSWAHGTVGASRYCAPSNVPNPVSDFIGYSSLESTVPNDYGIPGLSAFIKAGYIVVASDYQGLGAGEKHEYAVGLSQARNALDIVRAARTMTPAGKKVALLGWSQGGLAVVTAGENASYAPELDIVGIAALAPANPKSFGNTDIPPEQLDGGPRIGRLILLLRSYTWAYPDLLNLNDVFTDTGKKAAESAARQCIQQLSVTGETAGGDFLFKDNTNPDAWAAKFAENAIGQHDSNIPVLVMQGSEDNIIPPFSTNLYVKDACERQTRVFYKKYPGKDHRTLLPAAERDFTAWIANRFANKSALSNCSIPEIQ